MLQNKKAIIVYAFFLLIITPFSASAEQPDWITRLPFTEDAFWGVGRGDSLEAAINNGKKDLLMQLNSRVEAVISIEERNTNSESHVIEKLETYLSSNSLRGAEIEEVYEDAGQFWALVKYCDTCGEMLVDSALKRYEEDLSQHPVLIMEKFQDQSAVHAIIIERRLHELELEEYNSKDIKIVLSDNNLMIMIMNFLPDDTNLTPSQEAGLSHLSKSLLSELEKMNYKGIFITGHANPTGKTDEEDELQQLSKKRAETMKQFLESAGILILGTDWQGGDATIGDTDSAEGRSRNRRVELLVEF